MIAQNDPPPIHVLVLNYNGQDLLAECLPSILAAAETYPGSARVTVIDNGSTDASLDVLKRFPEVEVIQRPNRGLASFNDVLAAPQVVEPIAVLLNNDVKLDPHALAPLVEALQRDRDALFAAPLCWDFDGATYEGMRTRVRFRFGLVQGLCRVPGHEQTLHRAGLTASAGPALAVNRCAFLDLGGYDPLYFPGRIEDLDLGFRAWMAGWVGRYVPESVAYHRGFGSFGPRYGGFGCDRLAVRNTLLFSWKNLAGRRLAIHLAWLPARVVAALLRGRWAFLTGLAEAALRLGPTLAARARQRTGAPGWLDRQEAFFQRFAFSTD